VGFLSISVDPAHDTPAVLSRYADAWEAGDRWLFVTGPPPAVYALSVSGFKLAAMEVPAGQRQAGSDGPFLHSGKFVLVDGAGVIRGYYDSDDGAAMNALARDLRLVRDGA
jgi:cytochrome oxidase Cu insertion factor (SCO1/SenC/PrrC family)